MKQSLCVFIIFSLILLSCNGDPFYEDKFYVRNNSNHDVKCEVNVEPRDLVGVLEYHNEKVIKPNSEKELFFSLRYGIPSSSFDNDEQYIIDVSGVDLKITLVFDDTLCYTYQVEDTVCNNPCLTKNWNVLRNLDKKKNKQHDILYTITEKDYQNVINQY